MKDKSTRAGTKQQPEIDIRVRVPATYGWKVLGKMQQDLSHLLTVDESTRLSSVIRSKDFTKYRSLTEDWGPQSSYLNERPIADMRAVYQMTSLLYKFRFDSNKDLRRLNALKRFRAGEVACGTFNRKDWKSLACIEDRQMRHAFSYARVFLSKVLGEELPSEDQLTLRSRHGPGANLDTMDGHMSTYFKYSEWPYSCTKDALALARSVIKDDERWLGALEDDYRERFEIPKYLILNQDCFWSKVFNVVPGNRIAFVPKNALTERSIAIEPSMNLYLQLGVDGFIRRRLKRWGVDLDSQVKNRELARVGSLEWEDPDPFITLDLAGASDSISVGCCWLLLPTEWFRHLMKLRSPKGNLNGESFSYEKISSMGNGFTFALESAIFSAVVYGVMRAFGEGFCRDQFAVYGDDIIVRRSISDQVVSLLNLCGFAVNAEKSFFEGPFRESCGADWFKGYPVRPVFLDSSPTSVMELWTDLNRLRRTLSLRFMEEESNTESLLAMWVPDEFRDYTGPTSDEAFDSYRHVSTPTNGVYNFSLWKYKRLVVRPRPVGGPNFFFRKLMHTLGEQPEPPSIHRRNSDWWRGAKLTGNGSRFVVTKPGFVAVGYTYSVADIWRSGYKEL